MRDQISIADEHRVLNSFIGFGYCELTSKCHSRLADFHELQLVFFERERA